MRDQFKRKMVSAFSEMLAKRQIEEKIENLLKSFDSQLISLKIEQMIDHRLEELTPKMVKQIIQEMIRHHLGWLVVWGGVFGALIGLVVSFVQ